MVVLSNGRRPPAERRSPDVFRGDEFRGKCQALRTITKITTADATRNKSNNLSRVGIVTTVS
jgi:hypothetical protein